MHIIDFSSVGNIWVAKVDGESGWLCFSFELIIDYNFCEN
jgi:hypothetical protein